jgi:glutathione S-transferase
LIRLLFAVGDIEYEDIRIKWEDWPTVSPTTPWAQLPILSIDGRVFGQSSAIARYIARRLGSHPLYTSIGSCLLSFTHPMHAIDA